ncbi:MAG: DUF3459 domain-containing protein, partial [Catenulispora sp.]|nr:DUF3459 domain-containing protein [Catenulispora sp.]
TLSLYRSALRIRHAEPDLLGPDMEWLPSSENVLAYRRGRIGCMINFGDTPVPLPVGAEVVLTSEPVDGELLPTDVAVWFRLP